MALPNTSSTATPGTASQRVTRSTGDGLLAMASDLIAAEGCTPGGKAVSTLVGVGVGQLTIGRAIAGLAGVGVDVGECRVAYARGGHAVHGLEPRERLIVAGP